MNVLSNTGVDEDSCTDRIRRICNRCHADGGMVPDYGLIEVDDTFICNIVANFHHAGHINKEVAKDCAYLAEEVCRFRFFLALRWQRRCIDPATAQGTIEACCLQRPTSADLANELIKCLGPTKADINETDRVVRQWAEDVYRAELAAFSSFEQHHQNC